MIQSSDVTLTFEEIVAASRCRRDWLRSEERRVGKEGRSRGGPCH